MKIIHQTVRFAASPRELFDLYLDAKQHGTAIGAKAAISRKVGARFSIFGGGLRGKTLVVVPHRMIVQFWRADSWKPGDTDSILTLLFSEAGQGGQIELIQANVPAHTCAHRRGMAETLLNTVESVFGNSTYSLTGRLPCDAK